MSFFFKNYLTIFLRLRSRCFLVSILSQGYLIKSNGFLLGTFLNTRHLSTEKKSSKRKLKPWTPSEEDIEKLQEATNKQAKLANQLVVKLKNPLEKKNI